ncbi:MAG: type II secretion system F family protein [Candidatus Thiodiazotropha sp. (ex Lucinoma borealis)]|nr:type II secretion system F family protein [Candidatus Thiodiazotropha sp. (ex Troendleina suluensis)]MCU7863465.1 type II secretion system F family protein [Candidatus Thiodiazotropha sp. (ex Lucinoma borealis)]
MELLTISLLFGGILALIVWNSYRVFAQVPDQDRSYLDRPPLGFRLAWPLVNGFVHYFGSLISQNYRIVTLLRLRKAGLDYMLSPDQFFAGKVVAAVLFASFAYLVLSMLGSTTWYFMLLGLIAGFFYPELWLREATELRNKSIFRDLPFYLDIIILAVEAGTNFTGGLQQAINKATDGPLRQEFSRVIRDIRAGKPRADSLRDLADRVDSESIRNVVSSIIQAEKTGSSLGPVLKAQADQLRTTRFQKAEKMAMEAPVKLLGPLVMFIFPNTFLIIIFVILSSAIQKGVLTWPIFKPLIWAFNWPG